MNKKFTPLLIILFTISLITNIRPQFIDNFEANKIKLDPNGLDGWGFLTGDGTAVMDFTASDNGYAVMSVDAAHDKLGIWWAIIVRDVSKKMDLSLLKNPKYEFRIESRIRVSSAPKRVNLSLNTQRTTDFHSNLMEFDIPDTVNWHTISFTTHNFDAVPGDTVYGQLAMIDWGLKKYHTDIDYFKVDILNIDSAAPDKGVQVPYHPPIKGAETFTHHIPVIEDAVIDLNFPDMNFNQWSVVDASGQTFLLTASGSQYAIMRWDLTKFKGMKVDGSGLLDLTTYSLERSTDFLKDFGMVRITEILAGDPAWEQNKVTYNSLCGKLSPDEVINSQMIIDIDVSKERGSKNLITISQPVMQRLIDGKTLGIAIKPLGAVNASFYAMENNGGEYAPKLHFKFLSDSTGSN